MSPAARREPQEQDGLVVPAMRRALVMRDAARGYRLNNTAPVVTRVNPVLRDSTARDLARS